MRKIAVIGSGPAGCILSFGLIKAGFDVTLYSDRTPDQWLDHSKPTGSAYLYDETIDMAPQESQDVIKEFGRPEYADWIANNPLETPLEPKQLVEAFRIWDEKIGAKKG